MELKNQDNLHIFKQVKSVPEDATRPFKSSYGKKLTEIDPMWRIEKLTELFGVAGEGWYTEVTRQESITFANGEVCIFTDVDLYIKDTKTGKWSKPIRGTGGNRLVTMTENGLVADDEAYKKAYTDALGIACKALGFGADIYRGRENTKYSTDTAAILDRQSGVHASDAKQDIKPSPAADGLPTLSPEHPRWNAFISWAAKQAKAKPNFQLSGKIRQQWNISDEDFLKLMQESGRA